MDSATLRHATEPAPALLVLLDRERLSLWDRDVSSLEEDLEERLDDVFVTAATVAGTPSVADALATARFAGCTWAILAVPGDVVAVPGSFASPAMATVTVRCGAEADALAAAYLAVREPGVEVARRSHRESAAASDTPQSAALSWARSVRRTHSTPPSLALRKHHILRRLGRLATTPGEIPGLAAGG